MTLSLNPTLTQEKQQENKEIQVDNIDIVTQHKPMPTQQDNNTESSINTQEPIGQTPNTTQDFDINNKEYQEFVKEFLTTKQTAKDHYDLKYSKDLLKQSIDKFEITQLANPLFIANNIKDMGREGIEFSNKSGDQIKKSETELYDYLAKTGINHEMLGIKNFDEQKLEDAHIRQGLRGKTEYKQLNEKEKDYLKRQQNWAGALWDKMVHSEEKRVEELLRNDTRRYIDPDLLTDLIKIDSVYSSVLNVMKSSETATQDLQKKLKEMDIKAKERGYAAAVYDKKAKALAIIDKQGKKYYLNEDGVTANLDKIIVNNWNDILLSSIPVGGWGVKGAQLGVKGAGIALKNAGFKGLGKEAAKAGAISFAASPLDYVTLRNEVGGEIDTTQMLEFSAGNALGSAAGVMAIGTLAKGAGKAYNSIKDLKNLSTDDLKNIKISKYLDNEEASIHRKLAKFNKSEIDSNYEIFKGLQSDRVISKEMKDPTFMGNFMDKISDYNVLKHLSSKKESQDKLLSALFSNKELAREFAGKLTSEEATIVNKAIHAMGENFTRLSKEYEQQIIDEYAKSGKIKGLTPHTESSIQTNKDSVMLSGSETSHLNGNKDVFTFSKSQHDKGLNQYDINFNAPTKQVKSQMIEALKPIFNQTMTSSDGVQAYMSLKSLSKMTSPQAIQKSIDNGFSREEHLKAVLDIQRLFENAKLQATEPHKSGEKNAIIHRLNSELENGNALITTKESLDANKNRVYSLELELTPRFSDSSTPLNTKISEGGFNSQKGHQEQTIKAEPSIAKTDTDIIPQNLPEVYKHMLDEIDKQAKQDYKTSIDNLQNALNDIDFKATLLQGYKQVTDDAIDSLGLDNQLTNTLIRETQKLESKPNISLAEAIELRKNINEIMRNYEKSSSDLKKFRANKHLDNIKDNIDNAIKNALDSKVIKDETAIREFGENYPQFYHKPQEAINHLLETRSGQVQAAMHKKGVGDIDFIWGDSEKGLQHILERRTQQYGKEKALKFVKDLPRMIDEAVVFENLEHKIILKTPKATIVLGKRENNQFVLSGFYDRKNKKLGISSPSYEANFTDKSGFQHNDGGVLLSNRPNPTQNTLTRQEADELFSNFQQANKNYAQIKESLNDKFAKALTKGMNKKDLDSRLTIEQWKQRVLDTQWGDSVKGLENTIFKNFNPRMQKHTQMLTILRALDRNVKLNDDSMPIDFTKILSDIENLEKLTLHPEIYPILDTFKSYAKSYQFAQEISKAKALENKLGGGALATTLEGRIKVFLTNRLFKKLFAFIPYIGDNAAITKALQSAIKDLKYPSEITLETLKVLNKADLDKGFKPIKDKEPRFEYKAHTPLSDKDLQDQIKGNTQILNPKDTSEIEAIASNPLIQNMERQAKYNEELTQKISQFEANKENIQQDILNNLVVATQEIKQNTELLQQLAQQLTHNNPIHTPNKSIIKAQIDNETYFITTDKNNITAIEKQELQNLAQPKTYDELMQRDKNENATLESYRDQYADIAEIKEAQAQKQLLLEYKPEVAKKQEISKDTTPQKTLKGDSITNPDISYAIQNENIPKEIAEKIANNAEISNIIKRDNFNKASVKYYDKDNMTMYYANIGNYIDDEFGMKGDTFFLNNVTKHEFYIPPTKSLQDFKEQSLNQIEFLKKAIKTQIDNVKDEKELHKNIREIQLKARENAERRYYDEGLEQGAAREFYTTKYDEAMQELGNYYKNYRHLESNTQIKEAIPIQDKDTAKTESFIDSYGKTHEVPKEIAEQWKNTFNLKSLDEAYIPSFTPEVKQALDSILQGEQIKLTSGSLVKLMQRDRLEFLPFIKETLEAPNAVVRQVDGAIIFAKDYRDEKLGKFFASVSKNDKGEWVISSNAPKNLNNLQNKIKEGGEVLYSDLPELPIIAKPELPAKALNSEANLSDIIPQTPQTKPYEVNENGRKYIEIPDDELADFEKPIKQALLLEPRQQELLKKINADSKDIDSYAEFMTNERKIMKGHEFTFNQQQEGLADRFLNMANSLENPRDRNHYAENILANMKDDIEKLYKSNASEFLAREAEKPFYKQMDKIRKETDEIVEALNKERDRLHAEKEAQLKAQQETEKAAEIERIANYDLETAYKEKAHLEKIMQSNRSDYAPYSFSSAYNSEFLDKLDLVEQRIRDLKNKLPNKTPQENKPSKVEALKEFIDNARFQVNYAIKAKGTDTALKLIKQMIKDTNNTYEAKFLYRLKNEISSVKELPTKSNLEKDLTQSNKENTYILREQTKEILNSLVGKNITNQNDGRIAQISRKNIAKMTSDKAIQKSVDNGFTPQEHFKAVQDIENLYQEAVLKETHKDKKSGNPNVFIHRYNADFNGNNALITIKESLDSNSKGNKIYTLELESLELKPSAPEPQGSATMSRNTGYAEPVTPTETPKDIIPQTPQEIIKQAKQSGKSVKETKELLQKHNKEIQSIRTEIRKDIATRQKNIEQGYIDIVSSHHAKIGKKGGYTTKMYLETDKEKQSYLYDGFNKESVDNYLQLVKENAPLKERNKALDKLVNERLEAEERFRQLQKQQEELEDKQLQAYDEESFIKSLEGKSKDELENIQGDLWSKSKSKNNDIPFPVIARMSNLVMWIKDKIPQAAFNNDELREAIKSLRLQKEYKDDINSIQYFKENRAYIEQTLNIKPIKEFGTNYAEHYHSGETAIQKLINEAQAHKESGAKGEYKGQVAGAFHRKELGDIDLVWGEVTDFEKHKGYGLAHIIDKRKAEFMQQGFSEAEADKAIKSLLDTIPHILDKGRIYRQNADKIEIITDKYTLVVGLRNDRKLIITELVDRRNKKRLEAMQTGVGDSFTDEPLT